MRIEITKTGMGSKFFDDNGNELKNLGARAVTVEAEAGRPTTAIIELVTPHAVIDAHSVTFSIAGYSGVVGLMLKSGGVVFLPGSRAAATRNKSCAEKGGSFGPDHDPRLPSPNTSEKF